MMKKENIIPILILFAITGIVIYVGNTIRSELTGMSEEELKSINPYDGIKAVGFFVGCVMVLAFIYSFWWYPKKCIKEYKTIEKENEEYYQKMQNIVKR
jgi:hypothetical protein